MEFDGRDEAREEGCGSVVSLTSTVDGTKQSVYRDRNSGNVAERQICKSPELAHEGKPRRRQWKRDSGRRWGVGEKMEGDGAGG